MLINSDFSYLESTSCYCSEESANIIRTSIIPIPLSACHFIGTGDYHYVSLFFLERITEDFCLILFDKHPDDQLAAFDPTLLSCGSWVAFARRLPHCKSVVWIQQSRNDEKAVIARREVPWQSQDDGNIQGDYFTFVRNDGDIRNDGNIPIYISIDLDVLNWEYAHTDWDQGTMTLKELVQMLNKLKKERRILGIDICGGICESKGGTETDQIINIKAINTISKIFE